MPFARNEQEWQLTKQGYDIQYLSWDGDCWLSAISYLLGRTEISRWADLLKQEVVKYLQSKKKLGSHLKCVLDLHGIFLPPEQ